MAAAHSLTCPEPIPLENGDRLTRAEFHRRYEQHPEIHKAELIEGVVHVPSPLRAQYHGIPENRLATWLGFYTTRHPDVFAANNSTVFLDADNEPQPDISLFRMQGGSSDLVDGYITGAPELVIEISSSSASYDLHEKMNVYRRNGVQEYIVWRVYDSAIDWFELKEGVYVRIPSDDAGVMESRIFPGLRLPVEELLAGNLTAVLDAVR
jgi:Uma2 family endonuclease